MKYLLLTFDVEELSLIPKTKKNKRNLFEIGEKGAEIVLDLLKRKNAKATFFVTAEFAGQKPEIIRRILNEGHELASHGSSHEQDYINMSDSRALLSLKKSKKELEKMFNTKILGFRAPCMNPPKYNIIKKAGFSYDSSLHPTWVPGRYNNFFKSRKIKKKCGILIIPVSVSAILRLPFSWFWFRNFGLFYAKACSLFSLFNSKFINIYFHPWDFIDLNKLSYKIPYFLKRNSGEKNLNMLEKYIDWCIKKRLKPATIREFLEK